jgi:hypothetical protein
VQELTPSGPLVIELRRSGPRRATLTPVIYELRSYDIVPELVQEYLAWIHDHALPVMRRFGFQIVGFWWVAKDGTDPRPRTNIRWIVAWDSQEQMEAQWARMKASEEWQAVWRMVKDDSNRSRFHRGTRRAILHALVDPVVPDPSHE